MAVMRDKSGHTSKPLIKGEKAQSSEKKGLDSISPNQYLVVFPRCFPPSSSAFSGALFSDNVSRIETALKQPINAVTRLSFSQPPPRCRGTKQGKRNSPFFLSGSLVPNWARVKSTSRGKVKEIYARTYINIFATKCCRANFVRFWEIVVTSWNDVSNRGWNRQTARRSSTTILKLASSSLFFFLPSKILHAFFTRPDIPYWKNSRVESLPQKPEEETLGASRENDKESKAIESSPEHLGKLPHRTTPRRSPINSLRAAAVKSAPLCRDNENYK